MVESADFYRRLISDTRRRRLTLVHGDYSPKNILVRDGRLVLLDHEVIHFGEPAFDLGFAMAHLLSKAHHLPRFRDEFAEATEIFWSSYLLTPSPCTQGEGRGKGSCVRGGNAPSPHPSPCVQGEGERQRAYN